VVLPDHLKERLNLTVVCLDISIVLFRRIGAPPSALLATKVDTMPRKKHGNIPLQPADRNHRPGDYCLSGTFTLSVGKSSGAGAPVPVEPRKSLRPSANVTFRAFARSSE
jgi:hypothetical protein